MMGAGAFTLPVLPFAVLYEPPQVSGVSAVATYSNSELMGSTVTMSFGQQTDSTTADFDNFGSFLTRLVALH
jgi:hypothetical protein